MEELYKVKKSTINNPVLLWVKTDDTKLRVENNINVLSHNIKTNFKEFTTWTNRGDIYRLILIEFNRVLVFNSTIFLLSELSSNTFSFN